MVPYSKAHSKGKSTKTDKTDKKLNHLSFQSTEQLNNNMGIKRDKSGKSSSQLNSAQNLKLKTILYDLRIGKFMKNTNEKRNKIRRKMNPQYPNL